MGDLRKGKRLLLYACSSREARAGYGVNTPSLRLLPPSACSRVLQRAPPACFKARQAGLRTGKLIKGARLVVVKGGPHCITWTHADEVNPDLVDFLGE